MSLGRRLKDLAPGLTVRSVLEKMSALPMIDVHLPTTDHREGIWSRYTQPEADQKILVEKLRLRLPEQPPPKITAAQTPAQCAAVVQTSKMPLLICNRWPISKARIRQVGLSQLFITSVHGQLN